MIRSRTFALALLLPLFAGSPVFAQVFFRMDYSVGAAPNGGWPTARTAGATHTRTRIAGGGPQGEDAYDLTQIYTGTTVRDYGGEYYWGWNGMIEPSDPAQGARRYYRWRMRFSPTTNFRGVYSTNGQATTLTNKILMVGDGCGESRCRVIVTYRGADNGRQAQYLRVQIDGGEDNADTAPINVGEWLDIQVELDSSTSRNGSDGGYKIWINNNDYNNPNARRTGIALNPVRWRQVDLGAYNNNGLTSNGVHAFRLTGFEASTAFDGGWARNNPSTGTPAAPSNLRIVPPS